MLSCSSAGSMLKPLLLPNQEFILNLDLVLGKKRRRRKKKRQSKFILRHFFCWIGMKWSQTCSQKNSGFVVLLGFMSPVLGLHLIPAIPALSYLYFPLPSCIWLLVPLESAGNKEKGKEIFWKKKKKKDALLLGRFASMAGGDSNICYSY